jgi:asparagine synthase (glutamine-hydrolysing)
MTYRLRRLTEVMELPPRDQYARWLSCVSPQARAELYTPEFVRQLGSIDPMASLERAYDASDAPTFVEAVAHADIQLYLPDDLLVKMDIASMANSLEVRSPFLDHLVVEFAARLPRAMKLRRLVQKYAVKKAMQGILPERVLRRKKMGFGVPIDRWLREDLRALAYDVLLDPRSVQRGYFRPNVVRAYLDEHVQGIRHHHAQLWSLLMLELWHRMFIDRPAPATPPTTL